MDEAGMSWPGGLNGGPGFAASASDEARQAAAGSSACKTCSLSRCDCGEDTA